MTIHSANVIDPGSLRHSGVRTAVLAISLLLASGVAHAQTRLDVVTAFGPTDPQAPVAPLVQGADGNFYGTTPQGGTSNAGTVFQVTPAGALTLLYSFTGAGDGGYPSAGLIQGTDGNFYGTTSQGGAANAGTVFQMTPIGSLTILYSFMGTDGAYPYAGVIQGTDGNLYGTTSQGGAYGAGTIFQLSPIGTVSVLYSFTGGADGAYPYGGLIQGRDGNFYGTTSQGGASGAGTIVEVTPAGVLTPLYSFTGGTDGAFPYASLLQGTDGNFYGTTYQGGASNFGTAFQLTPGGSFTVVHAFSGGPDGAYPFAGLVQGTDGNLYGTTLSGGSSDVGTVFLLTPTGAGIVLYSFTGGDDGAYPGANLIQATDGSFYGTAQSGGAFGEGLVFRFVSTTPPITWNTPAPILFGTRLSAAQLNATSTIPGTFVYTPPAGTVLHAGLQTLTVTFTPSDTTVYSSTTRTVTLLVTPVTPVITWRTPAAIAYGTPLSRSQLNASANVAGTFAYSPGTGEVLAAGSQPLSAFFTPRTTDYTTATATVTLTVTAATPVIAWSPPAIAYGTALSTRELNATANTAGTFVYSPPVGTVLGLGSQTLSATFTPDDTADYTSTAVAVTLTVAIPAQSGGGNTYPLQFTPAPGYRGLVVAGYQLLTDPVQGDFVAGNCSYYTVHSGSGRGGGYKTITTHYDQTCTWDLYGNLLTVTPGAPAVPTPISVIGTRTTYASNGNGVYTGADSALPFGGFVYTPGSHYSWLTPNPYAVIQQAVSTVTVTLESDGDMPLNVSSAQVSAVTGKATVRSTTCGTEMSVGSTCAVTVTYDPTGLRSPTGLAYDTLDIRVISDAGQVHDFVQRYTIVLTPANTID